MTAERNIMLIGSRYRVLVTRRPRNVYGGSHRTLDAARSARDQIEASVPRGKTSRPRVLVRKNTREERRRAGLCIGCGDEPPKPRRSCCESCLEVARIKTAEWRKREHTPNENKITDRRSPARRLRKQQP